MKTKPFILLVAIASLFASASYAQSSDTVVMVMKGDFIKNSLPTATDFFVKDVFLGQRQRAEIKAQGSFSPQVSRLKFFYGRNKAGDLVGTVLFNQMITRYGPVEVGVAFTPSGAVSNVAVTRATAQTEPWIESVEGSALMKDLIGLTQNSGTDPMKNISESSLGTGPYFMAQVITTAVTRAIVYYNRLFQSDLPR